MQSLNKKNSTTVMNNPRTTIMERDTLKMLLAAVAVYAVPLTLYWTLIG
jgi:hypothetical protein